MNFRKWRLGAPKPFFLSAGPCVIESEDHALDLAGRLREITSTLGVSLIFKASFDKANRTSIRSFRDPGLDRGRGDRGSHPPLDPRFDQAIELLISCIGRVVLTGTGKSGIIGRKIAATLSSTGTPAAGRLVGIIHIHDLWRTWQSVEKVPRLPRPGLRPPDKQTPRCSDP